MAGLLAFDTPFDAGICDPAWLGGGFPPDPSAGPGPKPARGRAHLHEGTSPLPAALRGSVLILGNFDGLHLGHQALVAAARAQGAGRPLAVMSCEPHPKRFFQPNLPPFRLTCGGLRHALFQEAGFDLIWQPPFAAAFANLSVQGFIDLLRRDLGVAMVVAGPDFRFGRGRKGGVEDLARALPLILAPEIRVAGQRVSSSDVRAHVAAGDLAEAQALLGRPWAVGVSCRGAGQFSVDPEQLLPPPGTYLAQAASARGLPLGRVQVRLAPDRQILADLPPRTERLILLQPMVS